MCDNVPPRCLRFLSKKSKFLGAEYVDPGLRGSEGCGGFGVGGSAMGGDGR